MPRYDLEACSVDCVLLLFQMISGYQEHLAEFASSGQRSAVSNVYSLLGQDTCFALPGNQKPERRRKSRGSLSLRKHAPKPSAKKETTV